MIANTSGSITTVELCSVCQRGDHTSSSLGAGVLAPPGIEGFCRRELGVCLARDSMLGWSGARFVGVAFFAIVRDHSVCAQTSSAGPSVAPTPSPAQSTHPRPTWNLGVKEKAWTAREPCPFFGRGGNTHARAAGSLLARATRHSAYLARVNKQPWGGSLFRARLLFPGRGVRARFSCFAIYICLEHAGGERQGRNHLNTNLRCGLHHADRARLGAGCERKKNFL